MVLSYYGIEKSQNTLGRLSGCTVAHGTTGKGMVRAARLCGMHARIYDKATIDDLRRYIQQGIPVIVNWFSVNEGHYSVVVDVTRDSIVMQDPEVGGVRRLDIPTFMRVWFDFPSTRTTKVPPVIWRRMIVVKPQ